MTRQAVSLEVVDIATPCPADWDEMRGDEQVRFCRHCSLNVYNLSAMTRDAAERLVAEREGRLCVRFYRRLDGTVVTADCEGAIRLAARRIGRFARAMTAVVITAALAPLGFSRWLGAAPTDRASSTSGICVTPPTQPPAVQGEAVAIMGDFAGPAPQQPQPPPRQPFLGRIANPAKLGQMAVPLMGAPAPLPAPPPPPAPAATQPASLTTTQPAATE